MDENLRTWLWFVSVCVAMAVTPVVIGGWLLYGFVEAYRHWGMPVMAWSKRTLRRAERGGSSPSAVMH